MNIQPIDRQFRSLHPVETSAGTVIYAVAVDGTGWKLEVLGRNGWVKLKPLPVDDLPTS